MTSQNEDSKRTKTTIGNPIKRLFTSRIGWSIATICLLPPSVAFAQATAPSRTGIAEAERVIVTGSNIPTAEETGPNPVDTYRPSDFEKLGIRNATDLLTFLPQEAGGTVNLNIANGGDGTVQFNLRGLLAKETLVLVDGKRVASGSLAPVGFSGGVDINLLPFPIIDHIDILKDGASGVYGSDAIAGVVNFFLIHKFRGLEIGGSYGNTNLGASNDMGEWEAWIKAGTGDDKTEIVVIADFWERTGGLFSRDRDISSNANQIRFGGFDFRSGSEPGRIENLVSFRLLPRMFFGPGGTPLPGVNTPPPHSAPNVATSPFYVNPFTVPGIINGKPGTGITLPTTSRLSHQTFRRQIAKPSTVPSRAICVTNTWCCLPTLNMSAHFSMRPWQLCCLRPIHSRSQALT
jgi:outer membrane receptor protein involved in Fe transport